MAARAANLQHMPPFNAVKSRLERRQASLMPPIPNTVQEVAVAAEWGETWTGENYLSKHNQAHGFLLFGTDANFEKLSQCRQVRTTVANKVHQNRLVTEEQGRDIARNFKFCL